MSKFSFQILDPEYSVIKHEYKQLIEAGLCVSCVEKSFAIILLDKLKHSMKKYSFNYDMRVAKMLSPNLIDMWKETGELDSE